MLRTHHHSKSIESKEAFFYMLRNPEILLYESSSYVGESKKADDPKDKKNIRKKLKRKVTSYNYYFSYNNKEWIIGCEVIKNEFEQPYFISLRKNKKPLRNRNLRGLRPSPTPKRKYYMSTD